VLVTILSRSRQARAWPAPLGVPVWVRTRGFPEIVEAAHSRIGGNSNIAGEAIAAVQVATEHAECERVGAGEGVEERLLLDRVALQGADVPARDHQGAAAGVGALG